MVIANNINVSSPLFLSALSLKMVLQLNPTYIRYINIKYNRINRQVNDNNRLKSAFPQRTIKHYYLIIRKYMAQLIEPWPCNNKALLAS